jgi:hypothetical protein
VLMTGLWLASLRVERMKEIKFSSSARQAYKIASKINSRVDERVFRGLMPRIFARGLCRRSNGRGREPRDG